MIDLLTVADLKKIIKAYNLHDFIPRYSKLTKSKLLKTIHEHLKVEKGYLIPNNDKFKYKIDKTAKIVPKRENKQEQNSRKIAQRYCEKILAKLQSIHDMTSNGFELDDFKKIKTLINDIIEITLKYKTFVSSIRANNELSKSFVDMLKLRLYDAIHDVNDILGSFYNILKKQKEKLKRVELREEGEQYKDLLEDFEKFNTNFDAEFWLADDFTKKQEKLINEDKKQYNDDVFDYFSNN